MKISANHKRYINYILAGSDPDRHPIRAWNCPGYYLSHAFPWRSAPQGADYWRKKSRDINDTWSKEYYSLDYNSRVSQEITAEIRAKAFEEHMTEEDWAFLNHLLRDKRIQRDPFFSVGKKKIPIDLI